MVIKKVSPARERHKERGGDGEQADDESASEALTEFTKWLAIFTGALAFFTLLLVLAGAYQGYVLSGNLKAAQASADHIRAAERAWIIVQSAKFEGWPPPTSFFGILPEDLPLMLTWTATNHGETPAWVTGLVWRFGVADWPLPAEPTYPPLETVHELVITKLKAHAHSDPLRVTPEQWNTTRARGHCPSIPSAHPPAGTRTPSPKPKQARVRAKTRRPLTATASGPCRPCRVRYSRPT